MLELSAWLDFQKKWSGWMCGREESSNVEDSHCWVKSAGVWDGQGAPLPSVYTPIHVVVSGLVDTFLPFTKIQPETSAEL